MTDVPIDRCYNYDIPLYLKSNITNFIAGKLTTIGTILTRLDSHIIQNVVAEEIEVYTITCCNSEDELNIMDTRACLNPKFATAIVSEPTFFHFTNKCLFEKILILNTLVYQHYLDFYKYHCQIILNYCVMMYNVIWNNAIIHRQNNNSTFINFNCRKKCYQKLVEEKPD